MKQPCQKYAWTSLVANGVDKNIEPVGPRVFKLRSPPLAPSGCGEEIVTTAKEHLTKWLNSCFSELGLLTWSPHSGLCLSYPCTLMRVLITFNRIDRMQINCTCERLYLYRLCEKVFLHHRAVLTSLDLYSVVRLSRPRSIWCLKLYYFNCSMSIAMQIYRTHVQTLLSSKFKRD